MTKKGIYPYDYMDSFNIFNKIELPTKEEFFCILNNEHITDEQYKHAENVFQTPSTYIMYLDANSLYGWAMSQYLPTGGFKWLNEKEINKIDLAKYNNDSKKGLILEVDLDYLYKIHDLHNDYPLAAEKMNVNKNMLSKYCEKIRDKFNITIRQVKKK